MADQREPKICDYEGSAYRTDFWEGKGRDYEDRVERIALRRLLPKQGRRVLELGAGFGRLSDEFLAFDQVVLLDYSFSQLQYAREHYGATERFVYVAANAYALPFRAGVFDAATMIRMIHHIAHVDDVLQQMQRVLTPNAALILEYANKRNLKAIVRHALGKQTWSPYDEAPVEFVELNFDFHPAYIGKALKNNGFSLQRRLPVSFFRLNLLKDNLPTGLLVGLDALLQHSGLLYAPSVFTRSIAATSTENNLNAADIFACPVCEGGFARAENTLACTDCGTRYAVSDGIYDFKAPLE